MGVYEADRYSHLRDELRLIEAALHAQVPIIGVCLGSQLLAAALGARVYPAPQKEIGWYDVYLREAARTDRLWRGVAPTFTPLHWHGDVFDLPAGAVALASSALTEHQAFRYGDGAYGLLFHLEMGRRQIAAMVETFRDEVVGAGVAPETILTDTAACQPRAKAGRRGRVRALGRSRPRQRYVSRAMSTGLCRPVIAAEAAIQPLIPGGRGPGVRHLGLFVRCRRRPQSQGERG